MLKTIFISSYHGFIARNILTTGILRILKENNLRIIILVPPSKVEYFNSNLGDKDIKIEGISPREPFFDNWMYLISVGLISVENLHIRSLLNERRYFKFYFIHFIHNLLRNIFIVKIILRCIANSGFARKNAFGDLINKYKPDLVFSTDLYDVRDREMIREAKKRGIFTIGMVRSWDNVTTKGVMLAIPDRVIVPNEILRNELWEYNRIPENKIFVSGIPHYDSYTKTPAKSREQFFKEMGLDPAKKTIFFAPAGALLYKYDGEILKLLQKLKDKKEFSGDIQFLVRFHPGCGPNLNGFKKDSDFAFDEPGLNVSGIRKQSELTGEDNERLKNSLHYSDIVMTLVSSIVIDGAVFNKPTIVFSINPLKNFSDDIKKFMKDLHFKKFISHNLCAVSEEQDQFVHQVNRYLENPVLDGEKRAEIIKKYCYKLDGKSSERVAGFILNYINRYENN